MMNFVLVPLHGGAPIPLDRAIMYFGRGSECDVVLTESRKVSRKHCCVAQIDRRIVVRDLGSMNGIRINQQVLKEEGELTVGNILWVGDMGFRMEPAGAQSLKAAPIVKRVPLPSKKKPKTSPDHLLSSAEVLSPPPLRKRGRSSKSLPAQRGTAPNQDVVQLPENDIAESED